MAKTNAAELAFLFKLAEEGKLRPIIDRTYPLSASAKAFGYISTGHAKGKIISKLSKWELTLSQLEVVKNRY